MGLFDPEIKAVTEHETGHLSGLSVTHLGKPHCEQEDCTMNETLSRAELKSHQKPHHADQNPFKRLLPNHPPAYTFKIPEMSLCGDCADDLRSKADDMHTFAGRKMLEFIDKI